LNEEETQESFEEVDEGSTFSFSVLMVDSPFGGIPERLALTACRMLGIGILTRKTNQ
jgi:hypothetical protein